MKRLIAALLLTAGLASAGPLYAAYMATYPVRHVKKSGRKVGKVVKTTATVTGKVVKAVVW